MKRINRIIACILLTITFVTSMTESYCIPVEAAGVISFLEKVEKTALYVIAQTGTLINGDFAGLLENEDAWNDWMNGIEENPSLVVENDDGTITFSEEAIAQLQALLDTYLSENSDAVDVVWMPVISSDQLSAAAFYSVNQYYMFRSCADDVQYSFIHTAGSKNSYFRYKDVSGYIFYVDGTLAYLGPKLNYWNSTWGSVPEGGSDSFGVLVADSNGVAVTSGTDAAKYDYEYTEDGRTTTDRHFIDNSMFVMYPFPSTYVVYSGYDYFGYLVRGCNTDAASYVPIFKSLNAYRDWITGSGNYYRFDSGYTGGDITIDPNADYTAITDAITDVIKQSIANGENMSVMLSRMQAAFSTTLNEINGTLGDIEDNSAESNTILNKILALLEQQEKELQDYFKDLQSYTSDAQDFFKLFPDELESWFDMLSDDIISAAGEIVEAVKGISIGTDYGDVDSGDGESLWTKLGEGIAKILTAVLGLLKTLIFKGLDALSYLVGVMVDNIGTVFTDIGGYFERFTGYITENTIFAAVGDVMPEELRTIIVLMFFSVAIAGIIKYVKRG